MDCPKLRAALEALAAKHNFNLYAGDGRGIELWLPGLMRFVVNCITPGRITFGYYREESGDLVGDPEVCINVTPDGWVPDYVRLLPIGHLPLSAGEAEQYAEFIMGRYVQAGGAVVRISEMNAGGECIYR
jgi:hypothetical protein